MESPVRFSSCRGVSFEMKTHSDLFPIERDDSSFGMSKSNAWLHFSKLIQPSHQRSTSISSSHYCDLDTHVALDVSSSDEDHKNDIETQKRHPKPNPNPEKPSRLSILLLDQGLFTVYKRLFVFCSALNITAIAMASTGHFQYAKNRATLFSIFNIFILTLCRSELFLRLIFFLAVTLFGNSLVPISVKTATTSFLQSLGGVHSGCGVSSIAWLVYAILLTVKHRPNTSPEIVAVAMAILFLLCLSSLAAFPLIRHLHHNLFERTHRFAAWTALILLWIFVILTTNKFSTEFWFTSAITLLIIIPWLSVRRVPVKVSAPSGHASIIKFQGGVKAGILGRISPSPLSEWHAFGIISDGKSEHMMLAGAVGDFTKSLVSNPPSHIWVRKVHFAGLPYLVNMYDRVVCVATGSGICVFLSFLLQKCRAEVCVVWVAKGIEENFGKEIEKMMSEDPRGKVIIHDTAVLGRPNVAEMSVKAAKEWGAEVVIVTSNPEGSRDVVRACKASGIAAFGPIWDS